MNFFNSSITNTAPVGQRSLIACRATWRVKRSVVAWRRDRLLIKKNITWRKSIKVHHIDTKTILSDHISIARHALLLSRISNSIVFPPLDSHWYLSSTNQSLSFSWPVDCSFAPSFLSSFIFYFCFSTDRSAISTIAICQTFLFTSDSLLVR